MQTLLPPPCLEKSWEGARSVQGLCLGGTNSSWKPGPLGSWPEVSLEGHTPFWGSDHIFLKNPLPRPLFSGTSQQLHPSLPRAT